MLACKLLNRLIRDIQGVGWAGLHHLMGLAFHEDIAICTDYNSTDITPQPLDSSSIMYWWSSDNTPPSWTSVSNHKTCYINVFHSIVWTDTWRQPISSYCLCKTLHCMTIYTYLSTWKVFVVTIHKQSVACPRGGSGCLSTPLSSGTTARSVAQWQRFMLIIDDW